jgi:pimeloyl-ACP methyl ester carboxylesterase
LAAHDTTVAGLGDHGPAVLLVHALGLDWRMWETVMVALCAGRRVFAYDIRGHGSAAGAPTRFSMADTAADLIGVLDALELDRAHVVGLSYGGGIAQTAAVAHPDRFASLSLLATTVFAPPVLVLAGALDASTTPEIMQAISAAIPDSRYRELPDTPHMQTLERPDLVAAALDEFLPTEPTGQHGEGRLVRPQRPRRPGAARQRTARP